MEILKNWRSLRAALRQITYPQENHSGFEHPLNKSVNRSYVQRSPQILAAWVRSINFNSSFLINSVWNFKHRWNFSKNIINSHQLSTFKYFKTIDHLIASIFKTKNLIENGHQLISKHHEYLRQINKWSKQSLSFQLNIC